MSRILLKFLVWTVLAVALPSVACADPFSLTGNWNYLKSGGDIGDSWQFSQSYSLTGAKSLTAGSGVSGAFRYSRSRRDAGADSIVMSPSGDLSLRNDLFSLNLAATQTQVESKSGPKQTRQVWDITGFSLIEDWPSLRLNYGQSRSFDDQSPKELDTESNYFSASLSYDWSSLKLLYDYRLDMTDDKRGLSEDDSERHFVSAEYSEAFFDGKVRLNISQQYSTFTSDTLSQAIFGEDLFLPVSLTQTLVAQDDTPLSGSLSVNGALNDGNTVTATLVEIAQITTDQNLGTQTDFQPVNQLRVYLDREISLAVQSMLTWSIYAGVDNIDWSLVANSPPVSYDVEDSLTVVVVDVPGPELLDRYVKLVVSSTGLSPEPVYVTELEAGSVVTATGSEVKSSRDFVSYQNPCQHILQPYACLVFSYNLSRVKNEPDPGLENMQFNHALNANYVPYAGFSVSASIRENRDEVETQEERLSRGYSLSMQKEVWDTVRMSLGYSHSESFLDSKRQNLSDSINGHLNAQLFPDLSARLYLNWSSSETSSSGSSSDSYGWRLDTTARLTPKVDATAYYEFRSNQSESEDSDSEQDFSYYGANVSFRPSDILSLYASLNRDPQAKKTAFTGSASWRMTQKLQASISTSQELEQGDSESYSANLNWNLSSHFSLRTGASYRIADENDAWSVQTSANATF